MKLLATLLLASLLYSSNTATKQNIVSETTQNKENSDTLQPEEENKEPKSHIQSYYDREGLEDISNTIGVIVVKFCEELKDKIEIKDEDNTVIGYANFYNGEFYSEEEFISRISKLDYALVRLTCVAETEESYKIIINEETGKTGIIPKKDFFELQPWEEHIKDCIIYFEREQWGLYDAPNGNKIEDRDKAYRHEGEGNPYDRYVDYDDEFFDTLNSSIEVEEVQGEWMKINADNSTGWIQWKKDGILQFTPSYLM